MMTKNILLSWFVLLLFLVNAQTPTYYQNINFTLTGDSLKGELSDLIINTHSSPLEYTSSSSTDTWDVIKQSDLSFIFLSFTNLKSRLGPKCFNFWSLK